MRVKNRRGLMVAAWPVVMAGLVLGACGGSSGEAGSSSNTIDLSSTAFVTRPPVTTSTTIPGAVPDQTVAGEQDYEIQAGDVPVNVASKFEITVEDIGTYNGWVACTTTSCNEWPFPGSTIRIPPGAKNLNAPAPTPEPGVEVVTGGETEQPVDDTGETADEPAGDAIPAAGSNCEPGSYTIEEGDFLGRVADKFDVTVDALNAANATTADYNIFYVGLKIVIPAKSDC